MEKISSVKAAAIGALVAVAGLILSLYQVQGWKMPTVLAALLWFILFGLASFLIGVLCLAAFKAIKQIAERRAISASWVSSAAPGLLDCEVDGKRAIDRLLKEINRLQVDINRLATRAEMYSKQINDLLKVTEKRTIKKAKTEQQRANRVGKQIDRSAIYIEKRTGLFEILTKEIVRNYEVMKATLDVTEEKNGRTSKSLIFAFGDFDRAGAAAISSVTLLKQGAEKFRQSNLTKVIREASKRLENSLDSMLSCFTQFRDNCLRLRTELTLKCANEDSSIPRKVGSQS